MSGALTVGLFSIALIGIFIIVLIVRMRYTGIDAEYGKPYAAKMVKMIGGHPVFKRGFVALSIHPKHAIAFNRNVIRFSQIHSIRRIDDLPHEFEKEVKKTNKEQCQYLCLEVTDDYGRHNVIFTAPKDFEDIANLLIRQWQKYQLFA